MILRFFIGIILFFSATTIYSQPKGMKNLPLYDHQILHFGFTVGSGFGSFHITPADDFFSLNEVYGIEVKKHPDIIMGPIMTLGLSDRIDFRTQIILNFVQRDLIYTLAKNPTSATIELYQHTMRIESSFVEFPVYFKLKSERIINHRFYFMIGANPKIDLAAQKKVKPEEMPKIRLNNFDVAGEIGMGIDFYLNYFKFGTELKFSNGFFNIVKKDETQYSQALKKLNSQIVYFSIHLGG